MSRGRRTQIHSTRTHGSETAEGPEGTDASRRADGIAAFLAVPASGRGPGVLVIPPEAGLPPVASDACERLAREGFVALSPDAVAEGPEGAGLRVDAAIEALFRESATLGARVGVLGLGGGAGLALDAAARSPRVAAVVLLGGAPEPGGDASPRAPEVPVLVVLGEKDEAVASARALESRLREAGVRCGLRVQPGADGAFFDERRPDVHDPAASAAAWDAILAALRAELA